MEWGRRTFEKTRFIRVKKLVYIILVQISHVLITILFHCSIFLTHRSHVPFPQKHIQPPMHLLEPSINQSWASRWRLGGYHMRCPIASQLSSHLSPLLMHHIYHHNFIVRFIIVVIIIIKGYAITQGYIVTHLRQECVTIIKLVHLIKFRSTGSRFYPVSTAYQEWFSTPGNILLAG